MFNQEKEMYLEALNKEDKSKKGYVDKEIKPLLDLINRKKNYYTTSSCSGRIMVMRKDSDKKNEAEWLFVSHEQAKFAEVKKSLENPKGDIWFKSEPIILHICARDLDSAQQIVDIARYVGLKKSGIMASRKRIIVELVGTDLMAAPVTKAGVLVVSDDYLRILVEEANKKMDRNHSRMKAFSEAVKKIK
jgi:tRNA wybutosine-synthesizing protein 3